MVSTISSKGCKESQFYGLLFGQVAASMTSPRVFLTSPKMFFISSIDYSSSVIWFSQENSIAWLQNPLAPGYRTQLSLQATWAMFRFLLVNQSLDPTCLFVVVFLVLQSFNSLLTCSRTLRWSRGMSLKSIFCFIPTKRPTKKGRYFIKLTSNIKNIFLL